MIDIKEDSKKLFYQSYTAAMQTSQHLEKSLVLLIINTQVLTTGEGYKTEFIDAEEYYESLRRPIGSLLVELEKLLKDRKFLRLDSLIEDINKAKEYRNFLAHRIFIENIIDSFDDIKLLELSKKVLLVNEFIFYVNGRINYLLAFLFETIKSKGYDKFGLEKKDLVKEEDNFQSKEDSIVRVVFPDIKDILKRSDSTDGSTS